MSAPQPAGNTPDSSMPPTAVGPATPTPPAPQPPQPAAPVCPACAYAAPRLANPPLTRSGDSLALCGTGDDRPISGRLRCWLALVALVGGLAFGAVSAAPAAADSPLSWTIANVDGITPLYGISCPSASLCVAVDNLGNVLTSTDPTGGVSAWSTVDVGKSLHGVSCASASLCVAVDGSGDVLAGAATKTKQELCVVPNVKRKTLAAAKRALKNAHCAVGRITKHKSSTVPKGAVISSSPKAGSRQKAGTIVALTVSRGKH